MRKFMQNNPWRNEKTVFMAQKRAHQKIVGKIGQRQKYYK